MLLRMAREKLPRPSTYTSYIYVAIVLLTCNTTIDRYIFPGAKPQVSPLVRTGKDGRVLRDPWIAGLRALKAFEIVKVQKCVYVSIYAHILHRNLDISYIDVTNILFPSVYTRRQTNGYI